MKMIKCLRSSPREYFNTSSSPATEWKHNQDRKRRECRRCIARARPAATCVPDSGEWPRTAFIITLQQQGETALSAFARRCYDKTYCHLRPREERGDDDDEWRNTNFQSVCAPEPQMKYARTTRVVLYVRRQDMFGPLLLLQKHTSMEIFGEAIKTLLFSVARRGGGRPCQTI